MEVETKSIYKQTAASGSEDYDGADQQLGPERFQQRDHQGARRRRAPLRYQRSRRYLRTREHHSAHLALHAEQKQSREVCEVKLLREGERRSRDVALWRQEPWADERHSSESCAVGRAFVV